MLSRSFIFFQVMFFAVLSAQAEELSLDDYVQKLAEHPQVLQILSKSDMHRELSSGIMGLPDPTIILGVDNVPIQSGAFDKFLPTSKTIGFSQKFPNYSLRKAKYSKQQQLSSKQKIIADFTKERLKSMLIAAIVKLAKVKQQQEYANKQINHYKEIEEYFKGRLEAGNNVYWRFSQVDVERSLVEQKLNNLTAERVEIEAELIRLVDEVPELILPSLLDESWQNPEDLYPVKIAQEDINIAKFDVTAAKAAYRPNYGVTALYKQREDGANYSGEDWYSVKASMSVPLWFKWNQAPKKRAAMAQKYGAVKFFEDTKLAWIKNMATMEGKRDAALNNVLVLANKDAALKEMVAATKRTYESGETSLEVLLDAKINRLTIKSQLAQEQFKYMAFVAEINSYIRN